MGSFYNVLYLLFGFLKVFSVCIFENEMSFSFFADCSISDISSLLFVFGTEQQASSSGCCWSCSPLRFFCNSASCFSSYCFNTMISFLCSLYTQKKLCWWRKSECRYDCLRHCINTVCCSTCNNPPWVLYIIQLNDLYTLNSVHRDRYYL